MVEQEKMEYLFRAHLTIYCNICECSLSLHMGSTAWCSLLNGYAPQFSGKYFKILRTNLMAYFSPPV